MKARTVKQLLYAQQMDMGGMPIRQPLPGPGVDQLDPFLLLHHASIKVPAHTKPAHAGVGPHPHRGFSPVTFIFKGGVHHRDSRGNNSVIYEGGAQWMSAGMGMIHSERPPADIQERGGRQEIIQLWINTPAKNKMDAPSYVPVPSQEVPTLTLSDGVSKFRVFSGVWLGLNGPVKPVSPVQAATAELAEGGQLELPVPAGHSAMIYLLDGKVSVDTFGLVDGLHLILFNNDGEGVRLTAKEPTRMLVLSGAPLDEEVVSYGPFVMNNQTQIMEAMRDYQMGKMGVLIED